MKRWVALVAIAAFLTACDQSRPTGNGHSQNLGSTSSGQSGSAALRAMQQLWADSPAYAFTFRSSCGERSGLGTYRVTVADGKVVKARPLLHSPPVRLVYVPTLAELTAIAQKAQLKADKATVKLSPDGYPRLIDIDWLENTIDDEACYLVDSVVVEGR